MQAAALASAGRWTLGGPPAGTLRLALALLATARALLRVQVRRFDPGLLQVWSSRVLGALRVSVQLEAPLPEGAQLWAANHLSWLDPLVLLSLRPAGALAKQEVAAWPLVGGAAARTGLRFVAREEPLSRAAALAAMAAELRRGRGFLLFPEGTTSRGTQLGRVHSGGLLAAHRLGVPALPLRLDCDAPHYPWTGEATLLPHLQALAGGPPVRVRVRPGPCLHPEQVPDPYEWLARIRRHLAPRELAAAEPPI